MSSPPVALLLLASGFTCLAASLQCGGGGGDGQVSFELLTGYAASPAAKHAMRDQLALFTLPQCIDACKLDDQCAAVTYETGACVSYATVPQKNGNSDGKWSAFRIFVFILPRGGLDLFICIENSSIQWKSAVTRRICAGSVQGRIYTGTSGPCQPHLLYLYFFIIINILILCLRAISYSCDYVHIRKVIFFAKDQSSYIVVNFERESIGMLNIQIEIIYSEEVIDTY